jgi:phosphoenolpyruvate carboxykinase (GTP)
VNWFRKDDQGNFMWPGYGDNARVLKWIFERSDGKAKGVETPIGIMPDLNEFDTKGLTIKPETMKQLFEVDKQAWLKEMADLKAYYHALGEKMPKALYDELDKEIARLNA